jgi:hypothetical protein
VTPREKLIELLVEWVQYWGEDTQLGDETLAVLHAEGSLPKSWEGWEPFTIPDPPTTPETT